MRGILVVKTAGTNFTNKAGLPSEGPALIYELKFYFSTEARYAFSEASSFTLGVWINAPSTMK